jgi:hypothetical protein
MTANVLMLTGSRRLKKFPQAVGDFIQMVVDGGLVKKPDLILHGGAEGFDTLAADALLVHWPGIEVEVVRPDYETFHPKVAPKIRNREMARRATACISLWDGISPGTANALAWAAHYKLQPISSIWSPEYE